MIYHSLHPSIGTNNNSIMGSSSSSSDDDDNIGLTKSRTQLSKCGEFLGLLFQFGNNSNFPSIYRHEQTGETGRWSRPAGHIQARQLLENFENEWSGPIRKMGQGKQFNIIQNLILKLMIFSTTKSNWRSKACWDWQMGSGWPVIVSFWCFNGLK